MATYEYTEYCSVMNRDTGETVAIIPSTGGQEAQVARGQMVADALNESAAVARLVEAARESLNEWDKMPGRWIVAEKLNEALAPFEEAD